MPPPPPPQPPEPRLDVSRGDSVWSSPGVRWTAAGVLALLSLTGLTLSLIGRAPASFVRASPSISSVLAESGESVPSGSLARLIDLNTASKAELDLLPGIGPVLAARIFEDRQTNGRFTSVEDLDRVHGIGPRTIERLRGMVTVSQPEPR